jgi:hypothetical protein
MTMSWIFGVLLLVVVAVYYLVPKPARCAGCGARRDLEAPLCSDCGWIHDAAGEDEDEDDGVPEEIDPVDMDEPWKAR